MRYEAILLDFYGTLVTADDEVIKTICAQCTTSDEMRRAFGSRWFQLFAAACREAHDDGFKTQRALAATSLSTVMRDICRCARFAEVRSCHQPKGLYLKANRGALGAGSRAIRSIQ